MSSGNLLTEVVKPETHPHDTTGAKTHLYGPHVFIKPSCCVKEKQGAEGSVVSLVSGKYADCCDNIKEITYST